MQNQTSKKTNQFIAIRIPAHRGDFGKRELLGYIKYGGKKLGWKCYDEKRRLIQHHDNAHLNRSDAKEYVVDVACSEF